MPTDDERREQKRAYMHEYYLAHPEKFNTRRGAKRAKSQSGAQRP